MTDHEVVVGGPASRSAAVFTTWQTARTHERPLSSVPDERILAREELATEVSG